MKREILEFNAKIIPIKPLNDEFTLCKCYVLALGKNRNYSYISKDTADNAVPTIYNIPVVGHLYVDEYGDYVMGGHDRVLARDSDGKLKFKSITVPLGVVPQDSNIRYEELIDSDGNNVTYQVADVILWTGRYPEIYEAIYDDSIYFGQSMEININDAERLDEDTSYLNIKKFSYSALCLLGKSDDMTKHVEPCFPESRVEPYHYSLDDVKFENMMNEFKEKISECFQAINIEKGGVKRLTSEVYNSVLAEFGLSKEELDFELTEEMTEDELREKLVKFTEDCKEPEVDEEPKPEDEPKDEEPAEEPKDEEEEPKSDEEAANDEVNEESKGEAPKQDEIPSETDTDNFSATDKALTYEQKLDVLRLAARDLDICDGVNCAFHYLMDCDDQYVYINRYEEVNGESKKSILRVQYEIKDGKALFIGEYEEVVVKLLTIAESEELERQRAEYDELKKFQQERLEADRINEYNAVVSEFSDLTNNEEFSELVENKMSFASAEALREKCYAIRGKSMVVTATKKPEINSVRIEPMQQSPEVYGGFFSKYPPKGEIKK